MAEELAEAEMVEAARAWAEMAAAAVAAVARGEEAVVVARMEVRQAAEAVRRACPEGLDCLCNALRTAPALRGLGRGPCCGIQLVHHCGAYRVADAAVGLGLVEDEVEERSQCIGGGVQFRFEVERVSYTIPFRRVLDPDALEMSDRWRDLGGHTPRGRHRDRTARCR